jgi:hypothetical protein
VPLKRFREKIFSTAQKTFINLLVSISQGSIMGGQNKRRQRQRRERWRKDGRFQIIGLQDCGVGKSKIGKASWKIKHSPTTADLIACISFLLFRETSVLF